MEVGPFGTSVSGEADAVAATIARLVAAATSAGATRVSLQVTVIEA